MQQRVKCLVRFVINVKTWKSSSYLRQNYKETYIQYGDTRAIKSSFRSSELSNEQSVCCIGKIIGPFAKIQDLNYLTRVCYRRRRYTLRISYNLYSRNIYVLSFCKNERKTKRGNLRRSTCTHTLFLSLFLSLSRIVLNLSKISRYIYRLTIFSLK